MFSFHHYCNCDSSFERSKGKSLSKEERITIQTLSKLGHTPKCISNLMNTSTRSVRYWIKRNSIHNSPGQDRKSKTTKSKKNQIIQFVKENPFVGTEAMIAEIRVLFDVNISTRTLRN